MWAIRRGWNPPPDFPLAIPAVADGPEDWLGPIRADAVLLGSPTAGLLRVRAFYVGAELTAVVHGRLPLGRRSRLLFGASVRDRFRGRESLVLPRIVDRHRGWRHAWILEEMLAGRRFSASEWPSAVPDLARELTKLWLSGRVSRTPVEAVVSPSVIGSLAALVDSNEQAAPGRGDLIDRVGRLRDRGLNLHVGWCHGDPVHGNWLRLADGRAALVDWEWARRRPVAHDAMKMLVGLSDPLPAVNATAAELAGVSGGRVAPWRLQIAAVLTAWLAGWQIDRAKAQRTGKDAAFRRRLQQRLDLLEQLLD